MQIFRVQRAKRGRYILVFIVYFKKYIHKKPLACVSCQESSVFILVLSQLRFAWVICLLLLYVSCYFMSLVTLCLLYLSFRHSLPLVRSFSPDIVHCYQIRDTYFPRNPLATPRSQILHVHTCFQQVIKIFCSLFSIQKHTV